VNIKPQVGDLVRPRRDLGLSPGEADSFALLILNTEYTGKRPHGAEIISGWLVLCPDGTTDIVAQMMQSQLEKVAA